MNWIDLVSVEQVEKIKEASFESTQLIFKHSTRCSISVMAKSRLDRSEQPANVTFHYLDLLNYRPVSNFVADNFNVHHESPQVLLIKNGECIYEETHNAISMDDIIAQLQ
jgi:bacillithiol system protein YtxJ